MSGATALPANAGTAGTATSRPLSVVRGLFVSALGRDTPGTDGPRLVAVLDALLEWSAARPGQLAFRDDGGAGDTLSFEHVGSKVRVWTVRRVRGDAPMLEIYPPTGRSLSAEDRARVIATLNAHSRQVLGADDRLRIGFGALKNAAARAAVLALLGELIAAGPGAADR